MSSPPSTGPTPGPLSTLDVRRVAAGGVGPSIMGFWGGGGMDSSSELFLECSVTSVISLFGLVTLLIFFANMTVGTRDAVVAKIQELSDGPSEVTLSDEKWERVQPCLLPKKGGFGSNQGPTSGETQVQQRRRRQAHRRRGAEDSLFDPEGIIKHSGHWSPDPTGGQGGNDKVGPRPPERDAANRHTKEPTGPGGVHKAHKPLDLRPILVSAANSLANWAAKQVLRI